MIVLTARFGYKGPDRIDITRKGAYHPERNPWAQFFAPSQDLLDRFLSTRVGAPPEHWAAYAAEYTAEMRHSYRSVRWKWDEFLALPRAVLVCYCSDASHCHRTLLAGILEKLGAHFLGEIDITGQTAAAKAAEQAARAAYVERTAAGHVAHRWYSWVTCADNQPGRWPRVFTCWICGKAEPCAADVGGEDFAWLHAQCSTT